MYNASMLDARQIAAILREKDQDVDVSPSTLHYYVQVGILPPAIGRGRSSYTPEHLTRFRLARRLKRQGLGLPAIRERLSRLTHEAVVAELAEPVPVPYRATPPPSSPPMTADADPGSRYQIAAEALRARQGDTPRTVRFRGGFSLQVPPGTGDERIARLYAVIDAALEATAPPEPSGTEGKDTEGKDTEGQA